MKINTSDYGNIWFTSDWHIGHKRDFIWEPRGAKSRDDYVKQHILGINKLARPDDLIIHMGDVALTASTGEIGSWFNEIECKNFWSIKGNHDNNYLRFLDTKPKGNYRNLGPFLEITLIEPSLFKGDKARRTAVTLCHFPLQIWNKSHHGAWHLCGHSHNSFEESNWAFPEYKRFDCGVEAALEFDQKHMFSFNDVKAIMSTKCIYYGDHHNKETT